MERYSQIARNQLETVLCQKISTLGNKVKLQYFLQWLLDALTISNLLHAARTIGTWGETEFTLCKKKSCAVMKTTTPLRDGTALGSDSKCPMIGCFEIKSESIAVFLYSLLYLYFISTSVH